jgi:hypothetical protein
MSISIGVPRGEYVVDMDDDTASLISLNGKQHKISTESLLDCWNKAEAPIMEREYSGEEGHGSDPMKDIRQKGRKRRIQDTNLGSYGNMKYERDKDFTAQREALNLSLDDIVSQLGGEVDKSTVSRWGAAGGTPSSRMPSGENMIKLSQMGIDPDTFSDKVGVATSSGAPERDGGQIKAPKAE